MQASHICCSSQVSLVHKRQLLAQSDTLDLTLVNFDDLSDTSNLLTENSPKKLNERCIGTRLFSQSECTLCRWAAARTDVGTWGHTIIFTGIWAGRRICCWGYVIMQALLPRLHQAVFWPHIVPEPSPVGHFKAQYCLYPLTICFPAQTSRHTLIMLRSCPQGMISLSIQQSISLWRTAGEGSHPERLSHQASHRGLRCDYKGW